MTRTGQSSNFRLLPKSGARFIALGKKPSADGWQTFF
jgi:hypothetical protein